MRRTGTSKRQDIVNTPRSNFRLNTVKIVQPKENVKQLNNRFNEIKNERSGVGNNNLERENFMTAPIRPRQVNFDKIQALNTQNNGLVVTLSDKTLSEMFSVKVPDPFDNSWLDEKRRLTAVYKASGLSDAQIDERFRLSPPLGREQRTISKKINLAQSSMTNEQKMREMLDEIKQGHAQNSADKALLAGQLSVILANVQAVDNFNQTEFKQVESLITQLQIPKDHQSLLGNPARFVDKEFYKANQGLINLLFMINVMRDTNRPYSINNYNTPVRNDTVGEQKEPYIKLNSFVSRINGNPTNTYIDLHEMRLVNGNDMKLLIGNTPGNINNPIFSIQPVNTPPP
jgi:hypothetical protein